VDALVDAAELAGEALDAGAPEEPATAPDDAGAPAEPDAAAALPDEAVAAAAVPVVLVPAFWATALTESASEKRTANSANTRFGCCPNKAA
jgi:hypothetical protein